MASPLPPSLAFSFGDESEDDDTHFVLPPMASSSSSTNPQQQRQDQQEAEEQQASREPGNQDGVSTESVADVNSLFEGALTQSDAGALRALWRTHGVPEHLRGRFWQVLLGVSKKGDPLRDVPSSASPDGSAAAAAAASPEAAEARAEIHAEVCVVQSPLHMLLEAVTFAANMEDILVVFCESKAFAYRRGLARLVSPFLSVGLDRGSAYNCFYAAVTKFTPVLMAANETATAVHGKLLRLLLRYHDPVLVAHLDSLSANVVALTDPWLTFLFSSAAESAALAALWDGLFVEGDPALGYFVTAAFLMKRRATLLLTTKVNVEKACGSMRLNTEAEAHALLKAATELDALTPRSFRSTLFSTLFHGKKFSSSTLSKQLAFYSMTECLAVSHTEVVSQLNATETEGSGSSSQPSLKYVILDVRSLAEFRLSHLPSAIHIDLDAIPASNHAFDALIASYRSLQGQHLCLVGTSDEDTVLWSTVLQFVRRGFEHVSVVGGGYEALAEEWLLLNLPTSSGAAVSTGSSSSGGGGGGGGKSGGVDANSSSQATLVGRLESVQKDAALTLAAAQKEAKNKLEALTSIFNRGSGSGNQSGGPTSTLVTPSTVSSASTAPSLSNTATAVGASTSTPSATTSTSSTTTSTTTTTTPNTASNTNTNKGSAMPLGIGLSLKGGLFGRKAASSTPPPPPSSSTSGPRGGTDAKAPVTPSTIPAVYGDSSEGRPPGRAAGEPVIPLNLVMNQVVNVREWMSDPSVTYLKASAVDVESGLTMPRLLFFSDQAIASIMAQPDRLHAGVVHLCRPLEHLKKMSFLKSNVVKLGFPPRSAATESGSSNGGGGGDDGAGAGAFSESGGGGTEATGPLETWAFLVDDAPKVVAIIKERLARRRAELAALPPQPPPQQQQQQPEGAAADGGGAEKEGGAEVEGRANAEAEAVLTEGSLEAPSTVGVDDGAEGEGGGARKEEKAGVQAVQVEPSRDRGAGDDDDDDGSLRQEKEAVEGDGEGKEKGKGKENK